MALRLLREGHEARLERAARVHHADKAAQHKDEHHDVGGLHRARHHAHRDVGDAFGLLLQALVRVGTEMGLDSAPEVNWSIPMFTPIASSVSCVAGSSLTAPGGS